MRKISALLVAMLSLASAPALAQLVPNVSGVKFRDRVGVAPCAAGQMCLWRNSTALNLRRPDGTDLAMGGGGSTGNYTFATNTMDLSGAGVMQFGGTNATGINLGTSMLALSFLNGTNVGPPTFTTRTVGQKFTLWPAVDASHADIGIGVDTGAAALWFGVQTTTQNFRWYGGTTLAATLSGLGTLSLPAAGTLGNIAQGATNTIGLTIAPNVADGASSIGLVINSATSLANAAAKLVSLQNATVEKFIFRDNQTMAGPFSAVTIGVPATDSNHGIALKAEVGTNGGAWFVNQNSYGYASNAVGYLYGDVNTLRPYSDGGISSGQPTSRWLSVSGNWYDVKLGAQLTAATTITPTCGSHHVTGATTITNIAATNVPASGNVTVTLIADSVITFGTAATAGGIKVAPSTTLAAGKAMIFYYDQATTFWYPVQGG